MSGMTKCGSISAAPCSDGDSSGTSVYRKYPESGTGRSMRISYDTINMRRLVERKARAERAIL